MHPSGYYHNRNMPLEHTHLYMYIYFDDNLSTIVQFCQIN